MDAKTKAEFINSVGEGRTIPCPKCGKANDPSWRFCIACGTTIDVAVPTVPEESDMVDSNDSIPTGATEKEVQATVSKEEEKTDISENPNNEKPAFASITSDQEEEKTDVSENPNNEKPAFASITSDQEEEKTDVSENPNNEKPAFASITSVQEVKEDDHAKPQESDSICNEIPAFKTVAPVIEVYEEPPSIFAEGLASWDMLPPDVPVRRIKK